MKAGALLDGIQFNLSSNGLDYRGCTLAQLRAFGVAEAAILPHVQAVLTGRVDVDAEAARARLLTGGVGQALEYQETQAQAFAALANPSSATPELYPMLAASIGIDRDPVSGTVAIDVLAVARAIHHAYGQWVAAGAAIRAARLSGKQAIARAGTVEAASAAFDAIVWPPAD